MCDAFESTDRKSVTAFKVVARRGKKYYSLLTGNTYPSGCGNIPVWDSQEKALLSTWGGVLPAGEHHYRRNMVGRTAGFMRIEGSRSLLHLMKSQGGRRKGYALVIVKARISRDLLIAEYKNETVIVGRKMEILEEVA